jgi:hypothetical protein
MRFGVVDWGLLVNIHAGVSRAFPWFVIAAVLGPVGTSFAADPADLEVLKAAGGNVGSLKGGGMSITFQDCKLADKSWTALESLRDLKTFTIYGSGKEFGDEQLARLGEIKSIESIFFNAYGGTEAGLASLGKLPNLRHFGADHSPFTGTGLAALKGSKNFTSLRIGGCPFNDEGMKTLGELTQLKEANISHVRFTSAGFPNFAKLVNLEKLTINPGFYPYFVGADFVHLSGLKNLNTLIVYEMPLGYEDGLDHLKGLKLTRLEFHDCRISDADLAKLKSDLPDTTIDRTYSIDEKFKGWDQELERRKKMEAK